jgi:hypothetical protein
MACQLPGSRQSQAVGKSCFADCRKFQLAKGPLCRVSKKNSWQRKLQSAKSQFPVVERAYEIIQGMPMRPSISVWGALLGGCKMHGKTELGRRIAAEKLFELDPREGKEITRDQNPRK